MTDLDYPRIVKSGAVYSETLAKYIPIEAELTVTSELIPSVYLCGYTQITDSMQIQALQEVPLTSPLLGKYIKILNITEVNARNEVSWVLRYMVHNNILTDTVGTEAIKIYTYFTNLAIRTFLVDAQMTPGDFQEARTVATQEALPNIDWQDDFYGSI